MATTYEIWICDAYGNLLDIPDDWLYLRYSRAINNIGNLELGLNGNYDTSFLQIDGRVVVFRNGIIDTETTWLIRRVIKTLSEDGVLTVSAGCVSANELLTRRVVAYDAGTSYSDKTMVADNMMKQVVRENFGASATDAARNISSILVVEGDTGQGPQVSKQFSWNTVLDVVQDISQTCISGGSSVYFDIVSPSYNSLEFRTYRDIRGLDHTFPGGVNPVVMSPERGTLINVLSSSDWTDESNYVYAGGQGFSQLGSVQTASSISRIGQSPMGRREMFLNATQEGTGQAVQDAAEAALRENRPKRVFQAEVVNVPGSTEYGVHWGFGDKVTVEFREEALDASVNAIQVEVEDGIERILTTLRVEED